MGAVIKKEFWTVEQIFKFVDERLDKHAFYSWGMKEGASKREVIDKMIEEADAREYGAPAVNCVFNDYPLPNIVLCRARLYPYDGFSEGIGEDVWVAFSGTLVLGTLYAYREGVSDKWYADAWYVEEDGFSYWKGENYQMMAYKASMGDKEAKKRFDDFHSCKIPVTRIFEIDNKDDIDEIGWVLTCCAD